MFIQKSDYQQHCLVLKSVTGLSFSGKAVLHHKPNSEFGAELLLISQSTNKFMLGKTMDRQMIQELRRNKCQGIKLIVR